MEIVRWGQKFYIDTHKQTLRPILLTVLFFFFCEKAETKLKRKYQPDSSLTREVPVDVHRENLKIYCKLNIFY